MPDFTVSSDIDAFMQAANDAAARTELGLTTLATTTPGTGVATALGVNVGTDGAFVVRGGNAGTPSALVGTNITGTAAGLTAGTASAVAVGGITGLGTGVATFLATPSSANLASAVTGETGSGALVFGTSPAFTTNFTLANSAAPTTSAVAQMAFDTDAWAASRGAVAVHDGTATTWLVGVLASDTPSNGQVPTWNTGGTITWETPGGAANAVTAASAAASAGLFWVSGGADRTATATDTITTINATNANVTNLLPVSNDGAAIGASGTAFSDLFLASGAVINFNAGNLTLTHSAGTLTSNGAYVGTTGTFSSTTSLLLGTAGSAVGNIGFRNATSGTITLAPTTGALGTVTLTLPAVTATVVAAATSTTTTQALFATSTAGAPAFRALTAADITSGTLAGTITLGEGTQQIALDPALSADGTYSGIIMTGTAGYTQAFGDLVYLDPTDSRWEAADANSAAGVDGDARGTLGMVVVAGTDGNSCTILLRGKIRADAKFPTFTINNPVYVSETAGAVTQTQPTTTDVVIRIVGAALTADELLFMPDNMWITHT